MVPLPSHSMRLVGLLLMSMLFLPVPAQKLIENPKLDKQVKEFLESHPGDRYNMNVPEADGRTLYDLIVTNRYTRALEIGTSTGYSSIWIAWALSKTGGKLITIDIDRQRHETAASHFKEAGLAHIIDARLGDAHELVPALAGPFDFVFSDADKGWYKNYFIAVDPKLLVNGCYTTHNVSMQRGSGSNSDYLSYLKSLDNYETSLNSDGGGLAISYKRSVK